MMFTCVTPGCADSAHRHRPALAARKGSTKTVGKARAAASTNIVRNKKGRSLRVDIHCHYLNPAVHAKVAHLNPAQYEPSAQFANALTREVNVKQIRDRAPKLSSIEVRLRDMDRMGIDIQAVSPAPNQCIYWSEPGLGRELARMVNDHHRLDPASPWGGVNESGIGREFGAESWDAHFEVKSVMVRVDDKPFDWYQDTATQRRLN